MNYAQDRLDRRELLLSVIQNHLDDDSTTGNTNNSSTRRSTCTGPNPDVSIIDHTKYGQICMMLGWNIHALYHYGRAWYEKPTNCYKLGDYVQMMEIYGYPELALLTIFLYRTLTTTTTTATSDRNSIENGIARSSNNVDDDDIIRQLLVHPPLLDDKEYSSATSSIGDKRHRYDISAIEMIGNHCGCNDYLCGKYSNHNHSKNIIFPYWIPMSYTAMTDIVVQFQVYCQQTILFQYQQQQQRHMNHRTDTLPSTISLPPTAHEILGDWTDSLQLQMIQFISASQQRIPALFQFWCQDESNSPPTVPATANTKKLQQQQYRSLIPVVQLLCVKLLYLVLPSLAIEAVIHIRFQQQQLHSVEQDSVEDEIMDTTKKNWDKLSIQYKSHWAYYIFIEALVLGERIKPSRRRQMVYQHIALWDRLWGMNDVENGTKFHPWTFHNTTAAPQPDAPDVQGNESRHGQFVHDFTNKLQRLIDELYLSEFHKNNYNATRTCLPSPVYLQPILDYRHTRSSVQQRPLFLVGDSHVLSLAWQSIYIPVLSPACDAHPSRMELRLIVPIVITGLKAWHLRPETRFFTNTCLHTMLRRIPQDVQTIIISAGEIDCREGMGGPLLQGYTEECYEHVKATVAAYVSSLAQIIQLPSNSISQILVTPVAPHIERNKGRVVGHASRRETIRVWNDELRRQLLHQSVSIYLLNYIDHVQIPIKKSNDTTVGNAARTASVTNDVYALNPIFNADSTHMNGAFAPILQEAIVRCQCDLSKL